MTPFKLSASALSTFLKSPKATAKRAYNKAYYATHKEAIKQQVISYRKNHPDLVQKWATTSRSRHREQNRAYGRQYYQVTMEEFRQRQLARYKITAKQYDTLLANQNGVCAICSKTCRSGKRLAVDHCHETEKVRGLLCCSCNVHLGWFERRQSLITAYLNG